MSSIKTTGQLRAFLADALQKLVDGEMAPEVAGKVTKMAAQINESFYSEIKIARVQADLGRAAPELGSLQIGD